ncbi:hypothetical protein NYP18_02990 [Corynebacterium sp. YIM 101645]|uniref:Transposase n=1 Tax=Corynebacterium lemuris TaxID=1859292 RepID=A0ABT2FU09_9CORY|nr:hypothetical protein [Corynebacterium lemuris]MCS5478616.1 hypothetical protein [Corynebacterium lemuris]
MTFTMPPVRLSIEQKRHHALTYAGLPHGTKGQYLQQHAITMRQIRYWIAALMDGDLATGTIPRQTGRMTTRDSAEILRLQTKVEQLEAQLHTRDQELIQTNKAVDALGKAIAALRNLTEDDDEADQNSPPNSKPPTPPS